MLYFLSCRLRIGPFFADLMAPARVVVRIHKGHNPVAAEILSRLPFASIILDIDNCIVACEGVPVDTTSGTVAWFGNINSVDVAWVAEWLTGPRCVVMSA